MTKCVKTVGVAMAVVLSTWSLGCQQSGTDQGASPSPQGQREVRGYRGVDPKRESPERGASAPSDEAFIKQAETRLATAGQAVEQLLQQHAKAAEPSQRTELELKAGKLQHCRDRVQQALDEFKSAYGTMADTKRIALEDALQELAENSP
jgi:hypothetical protein